MQSLEIFDQISWDDKLPQKTKDRALHSLERGKVLFFPTLPFHLQSDEYQFLNPSILDSKAKNISYNLSDDVLKGARLPDPGIKSLKAMMNRYAQISKNFLTTLMPQYKDHILQAKTSFRPVEILGRKTSYRKDDTLLHVDSFPSNPTEGKRILRLFTNINQEGKPRVWRIGEPFEDVVEKMAPKVRTPIAGFSQLLKLLKITKAKRSDYDHYMLHIHNEMKRDQNYQKEVCQQEIFFPPGATWIVYTDQVSHAAMSGQHVLEQTFYLPINGLNDEATAPLRVLERALQRSLL